MIRKFLDWLRWKFRKPITSFTITEEDFANMNYGEADLWEKETKEDENLFGEKYVSFKGSLDDLTEGEMSYAWNSPDPTDRIQEEEMTALDELYKHVKKYYDGTDLRADDETAILLCAKVVEEAWQKRIHDDKFHGDFMVWYFKLLEDNDG